MEKQFLIQPITDYSEALQTYGLEFAPAGYYWQVGAITRTQGWILHLSVVKSRILELIERVVPLLMMNKVPFKIAQDQDTVRNLLDGGLGYIHLGKIVSIYPLTDQDAVALAGELIELTKPFAGPTIPTDRHLGGIVYTRYGSFQPVLINNEKGEPVKHIYDKRGQLMADPYSIPFTPPQGIQWPFSDITEPLPPPRRKLLNYAYYPLSTIKPDAKGDVIKGLYFKKFWQIHSCLIKQGRQNMFGDAEGRDIQDRLRWQYELYQALHKDIPMPEVFDYFREYEDSYLAMAFIKGKSLRAWVDLKYQGDSWLSLSHGSRLALIDRFLEILVIIRRMHERGYVHRDITSGNFLIDRKGKIWLIDMELAWSLRPGNPAPPFALGTPGHMSPEQNAANQQPTVKEDIYGLGALAVEFFTNLPSLKLNQLFPKQLATALQFFIGDKTIAEWVSVCQVADPTDRPSLNDLYLALEQYKDRIYQNEDSGIKHTILSLSGAQLTSTIRAGLRGLVQPNLFIPGLGWTSLKQRKEGNIGNQQVEMGVYEGWHTGMAGPLWLIGKAKKAGFDVDHCLDIYQDSWKYIHNHIFRDQARSSWGLHTGKAGIAMALVEGLNSGLLSPTDDNIKYLETCFAQMSDQLNLAHGIVGQGIALLSVSKWMASTQYSQLLESYVNRIINDQLPDGSWDTGSYSGKKNDIIMGLDKGVTGVLWFLLAYLEKYPDNPVKTAINKSLDWLIQNARKKQNGYSWTMSTQCKDIDPWAVGYGIPGIALLFIKAYTILRKPFYGEIAENSLLPLLGRPVYMDFSLGVGLAGLGEIYLEAATAFKNPVWQKRADWIAGILAHSIKGDEEGGGYWLAKASEFPTVDLFSGNSGILHFLMRYQKPRRWKHPLWP